MPENIGPVLPCLLETTIPSPPIAITIIKKTYTTFLENAQSPEITWERFMAGCDIVQYKSSRARSALFPTSVTTGSSFQPADTIFGLTTEENSTTKTNNKAATTSHLWADLSIF
ncbi:hypothetical protein COW99_05770 [Candidatus Roizmanbacteria bacterium CG22_combo_CG10-13_8_21_14_all_38_20]|uniref:Uncharacterized protein n=1 Tax=Candidatus Roizmanbacteria bacterium CG22_combo_CG10-13_8_21_14_all_38_20 TaxID=1974862 RepID=A0A2H0BU19_9BACT|nr:MAG: hypothetical protein COW99_05770 [Candidatus Roizmanbacteria bacterium CG22_combo_CG10-13_8_21_14_all_38_20]PJC32417.1 MAG: hypothetical protein CO050_00080 [Candidatus Roizmanbacteria bacterium CG_4_9_14_0_2_um_filter_38_17]